MALLALMARPLCADLRLSSGASPSIQNVPDQNDIYLSISKGWGRGGGGVPLVPLVPIGRLRAMPSRIWGARNINRNQSEVRDD